MQINKFAECFGLDKTQLIKMINTGIIEANINDYGRLHKLRNTVDKGKAKAYFETLTGAIVSPPMTNMKAHHLLQEFILKGGFDV